MSKKTPTVAALMVLLVGLPACYFGRGVPHALATKSWPTTKGTVVGSMVADSFHPCGNGDHTYLAIYYVYQVEGVSHHGDQALAWPACPKDKSVAQKVVDRYPTGTTVEVHYNPADPDDAVLETGVAWFALNWPYYVAGAIALILITWHLMRGSPRGTPARLRSSEAADDVDRWRAA